MKLRLIQFSLALATIVVLAYSCGDANNSAENNLAEGEPPAIIPAPRSVTWKPGVYKLPQKNTVCYNEAASKSAKWLKQLLGSANLSAELISGEDCGNWQLMQDSALDNELGEEGYHLEIGANGIVLKSATDAGMFYGLQTLRQFFPASVENNTLQEEVFLQQGIIKDRPQYSWRGSMVDVARSFFGLEYLKKHVDRMALYKLNRLHLHLTDDQGWRIEIKSKPELTEIGGNSSVEGGNSGFLTQQEYKELQEYAMARNIIIIPEIDMPGHTYAALRSLPEINCEEYANLDPKRATPPEPYRGPQVGWSKLCLEKPEVVYDFVSQVIGELSEITSGQWIHIGGDEIEDPLYEEFVVKADSIVQQYGKTSIGWEEVTKAHVSSSLISQQWHGEVESVVENNKVIESICSSFYLDHANVPGQEKTNNWCKKDGVSLKDVYDYRSHNPNAIGVEAAVWTEYVLNDKMLDDRFWPRLIAVAEISWSPEEKLNFNTFKNRLSAHSSRLEKMGVNHFLTPEIKWEEHENSGIFGAVFSEL